MSGQKLKVVEVLVSWQANSELEDMMGKKVNQYMSQISKITVKPDVPMLVLMRQMVQEEFRAAVVVDLENNLIGIITGSDVIREMARELKAARLLDGFVEMVMLDRDVAKVKEDTLMIDVVEKMYSRRVHNIVVVDKESENKVLGVITQLDIMRWWLDQFDADAKEK